MTQPWAGGNKQAPSAAPLVGVGLGYPGGGHLFFFLSFLQTLKKERQNSSITARVYAAVLMWTSYTTIHETDTASSEDFCTAVTPDPVPLNSYKYIFLRCKRLCQSQQFLCFISILYTSDVV